VRNEAKRGAKAAQVRISDVNLPPAQVPKGLPPFSSQIRIVRITSKKRAVECTDVVAQEEPLEIRIRNQSIVVTMRTPGNDRELAAGFLISEGIIGAKSDIIEITPCAGSSEPENTLNVFLPATTTVALERLTRHVYASSSCGLCGKASIEAVHQHFEPIAASRSEGAKAHISKRAGISTSTLSKLPEKMRAAQKTFAATGGLHAAAVFDFSGKLLVLREDIGRHNAVDKVVGYGFLAKRLPLDAHVLIVSGRASFEIMQKALAARVPVVAAISAPSSLAVEFAAESGQTLVGFLRAETMNIYSHPERVLQ
jgi:FdhD protein